MSVMGFTEYCYINYTWLLLSTEKCIKQRPTCLSLTWQTKAKACLPDHFGQWQNLSTSSLRKSTSSDGQVDSFLMISLTWKEKHTHQRMYLGGKLITTYTLSPNKERPGISHKTCTKVARMQPNWKRILKYRYYSVMSSLALYFGVDL